MNVELNRIEMDSSVPFSTTLGAIVIAAFAVVGPGGAPSEPACDRHVQTLAKELVDTVGLDELKLRLADAGLLCNQGRDAEADEALTGIERAFRRVDRRS